MDFDRISTNKVNTKKSALVQPLTCARFNLNSSHQANSDLYFAYSGDVIEYYLNLKLNYEHMAYFYCMVEIILKGMIDERFSRYTYHMFKQFLTAAEEGYSPYLLNLIFQLKMLPALGIAPVMDCCAVCRSTEDIVTLSIRQGGLVCKRCYQPVEPILIDAPLIPMVRALYKLEVDVLPDIDLDEDILKPIEQFLDAYYDSYAGFKLQTKKFINDL